MRKILLVPVLAMLAWSGYWLWGAHALQRDIATWLDARAAEGWQAEAADLSVSGFPLRFETVLTELALADPETGLAWQVPRLAFSQSATAPRAVTILWPDRHVLRTPQETFAIRNDALTADLETGPGADLPLARAALRAETLTLEAPDGSTTSLANLTGDITRAEDTTYTVSMLAEGVALSAPLLGRLDPDLPQRLERAQLDLTARFDRPWDLRAVDIARPQPTRLDLRLFEAAWGPMALRASADLDIDADGIPTGTLAVQARNWRDVIAVAEQTGALAPGVARAITDGLGLLAGLSGNREALDIEVRFEGGRVFLGPVPLGPAPRIRLR